MQPLRGCHDDESPGLHDSAMSQHFGLPGRLLPVCVPVAHGRVAPGQEVAVHQLDQAAHRGCQVVGIHQHARPRRRPQDGGSSVLRRQRQRRALADHLVGGAPAGSTAGGTARGKGGGAVTWAAQHVGCRRLPNVPGMCQARQQQHLAGVAGVEEEPTPMSHGAGLSTQDPCAHDTRQPMPSTTCLQCRAETVVEARTDGARVHSNLQEGRDRGRAWCRAVTLSKAAAGGGGEKCTCPRWQAGRAG